MKKIAQRKIVLKIKIKPWNVLEQEIGLESKFGKNIKSFPWFTIKMDVLLPKDRIIDVVKENNGHYKWGHYRIAPAIVEEVFEE